MRDAGLLLLLLLLLLLFLPLSVGSSCCSSWSANGRPGLDLRQHIESNVV